MINSVLLAEDRVVRLERVKTDDLGEAPLSRGTIYDIRCLTADGRHIIIEVQRAYQREFMDRALYYGARALTSQMKRGDVDYILEPVYVIAVLEFEIDKRKGHI